MVRKEDATVALVLAALIGYLLGSIPNGYLIGMRRGVDVRKYGSGATGATNVLRTLGAAPAAVTAALDAAKGLLAVYIGYRLGGQVGYAWAGFGAVVGHSFPVWLRFRGGKSVVTGWSVLLPADPLSCLIGLAVGIAVIIPSRWVSLGSLTGALLIGILMWARGAALPYKLLALGTVLVIYVRHWENIKRIAAGTENRLGEKARPRA